MFTWINDIAWERNVLFLSWHIKTEQLLNSVALLSSSSDLGTMADTDTVFVSFFNDVPSSRIGLHILFTVFFSR